MKIVDEDFIYHLQQGLPIILAFPTDVLKPSAFRSVSDVKGLGFRGLRRVQRPSCALLEKIHKLLVSDGVTSKAPRTSDRDLHNTGLNTGSHCFQTSPSAVWHRFFPKEHLLKPSTKLWLLQNHEHQTIPRASI